MSHKGKENKMIYVDMQDICVSCGASAAPGNQICNRCIRIANGEEVEIKSPLDGKRTNKGLLNSARRFLGQEQGEKCNALYDA